MDYFLTEEQKMLKELARRITEEHVIPLRAEFDEKEEFPWPIMRVCAEVGLFGVAIPEQYGGSGGGVFETCLVIEELSRGCLGVAVSFAASSLCAYPIMLFGTEEQKRKYLPELASGRKLGAFAVTEADAGSDVSSMKTEAIRDGKGYRIRGTKQWITNGGEADIYVVFCRYR